MASAEHEDVWQVVVPSLDLSERRMLTMIYIEGLTQRQIARRLRIQRDAVASTVARAMRVIAARLENPIVVDAFPPREDRNDRPAATSSSEMPVNLANPA
jgi:DNA-binding CsgD family transcriptional regulator